MSFQSANIAFEVCIVDDASLCSEAEILPLFRLKLNTLLLVGDERLQTSTTQNEVSIFSSSNFAESSSAWIFSLGLGFFKNQVWQSTIYMQIITKICIFVAVLPWKWLFSFSILSHNRKLQTVWPKKKTLLHLGSATSSTSIDLFLAQQILL